MYQKMKIFLYTTFILAVGLSDYGLCSEKPRFHELPDSVQLSSPEIYEAVSSLRTEFKLAKWPMKLKYEDVPKSRIPLEVFRDVEKWTRTIIQDHWLPPRLKSRMRGLIDGYPPRDYLMVRFRIGQTVIQVVDTCIGLAILLKPDVQLSEGDEIEQFISNCMHKYILLEPQRIDRYEFRLRKENVEGRRLFHGTMICDFDLKDHQSWERRIWWNHVLVWTDGEVLQFCFAKLNGKKREMNQVSSGISRRFK